MNDEEAGLALHDDPQQQIQLQQQIDNYQLGLVNLQSHSSQYPEPPGLVYSYSGISNASSTPELSLHNSRASEQQPHFTFIKAEKLYSSIQKMVKQTKQTLFLQEDVIEYIFYLNKWSKESLYEKYCDKVNKYVQINKKFLENEQAQKHGCCDICQQQQNLLKNTLCQHYYCHECWRSYIKQKLQQNSIFFPCMNKCDHSPVLLHSFVSFYFPQLFELYRRMICVNYTAINKYISYCPSKNNSCDYFCQKGQLLFDNSVECLCGQFYCFYCCKQPHYPATCEQVGNWYKLLNKQQDSTKWIHNNTRTCPACKTSVEKYIGCSKIKCLCGVQFCYECNARWNEEHRSNRGQCMELKKKNSLEQRTATSQFIRCLQWSISVNRTHKRHMQLMNSILELLGEQFKSSKLAGVRKEVSDAWLALKWSRIVSFIYKRPEVDPFVQESYIDSINRLIEAIEKIQAIPNMMFPKQFLTIADEIYSRREALKKNKQCWLEAWRSS